MEQNTQTQNQYWDPTGKLPDLNRLEQNNQEVSQKAQYWKKNSSKVTKIFFSIYLISLIGILAFIYFLNLNLDLITISIFYVVAIIMFYYFLYARFKSIKKDLIKSQLAKSKGWLYEPEKSYQMHQDYYRYFPEIFELGEKNKNIEDVFWGKINKNSIENYFVSGLFNYTYTTTQHTKNGTRRKDVRCQDHFFILNLPKTISSRFYIFPKNLGNKITNFFTKKNIQTESMEFNKTFSFSYKQSGNEVQVNIMSILSPRVIEELVNFSKSKQKNSFSGRSSLISGVEVLFTKNVVVFLTPGPLVDKLKVSPSPKSLDIKQEEIKNVEDLMDFYIDISTEISKYLN